MVVRSATTTLLGEGLKLKIMPCYAISGIVY
jgi:hypothetical protein